MYKDIVGGHTGPQSSRATSPTMGQAEKIKRKLVDLG